MDKIQFSNTYIELKKRNITVSTKKNIEFNDLYSLIGCSTVELIHLPLNIDLWVDEEGLLKDNFITKVSVQGYNTFKIAGIGILLSYGDDGYSTGLSETQVNFVKQNISVLYYDDIMV